MKKTLAMILAGGRGERMGIFCQHRPKPILPFAGNFQVIDFTLSNCLNSQIDDMAAVADYQRSAMTHYLRRWSSNYEGKLCLSILQPEHGSYCGTADAVYKNLDYIRKQGSDRVLILAGDHIYQMDYRKMLSFHEETKADVTVAVTRVPMEQTYRFGTISTCPGGQITEFVEKSANSVSNLVSMGIYIFNSDFLSKCLSEDAAEPNSPHDFGYAILPRIVGRSRVFAYEFTGYWQDIGTVEAYYEANLELLNPKSSFNISHDWPVNTSERLAVSSRTDSGEIVNSLISPGCIIRGRVENSILSPGVRIEEGAEVVNSIIMANTTIGYHSTVKGSILDEGVDIGGFCYVGFDPNAQGKHGITMVGRDVNVPQQTVIGRRSKILPGLRLSTLKTRHVAPGSVISVPVEA